jgi:hypothetical protein
MADTTAYYNHARKLIAGQEVDLTNLKVMLLDSSFTFDATDTDMTGITGNEVSGNGWAAGGEVIGSVAASIVNTNEAKIDGADVVKAASGGSIGPASYYVVYDATNNKPLTCVTFGSPQTATVGNNFSVTFNAAGIFTFTAPA